MTSPAERIAEALDAHYNGRVEVGEVEYAHAKFVGMAEAAIATITDETSVAGMQRAVEQALYEFEVEHYVTLPGRIDTARAAVNAIRDWLRGVSP